MNAEGHPEEWPSVVSVTTDTSVPAEPVATERPYRWQPDPRNSRALDRHIIRCYGPDIARQYGARYR